MQKQTVHWILGVIGTVPLSRENARSKNEKEHMIFPGSTKSMIRVREISQVLSCRKDWRTSEMWAFIYFYYFCDLETCVNSSFRSALTFHILIEAYQSAMQIDSIVQSAMQIDFTPCNITFSVANAPYTASSSIAWQLQSNCNPNVQRRDPIHQSAKWGTPFTKIHDSAKGGPHSP